MDDNWMIFLWLSHDFPMIFGHFDHFSSIQLLKNPGRIQASLVPGSPGGGCEMKMSVGWIWVNYNELTTSEPWKS